ncbi:argininosuccinate synthase [Treponema brennaborense]|uniref:Argininosuccinate synthase n=1 Tax=Treponema brennaborense (strain DSM 12168 / CIP 105900 / DD5/3) TaxID=906968 RepID=F4LM27_TREBD|nr:argininosuccinate synthase [Treponema brennaborense]AEE16706.1 Argininosuccinate synthase [Treponema brennaborense DSM 12168]
MSKDKVILAYSGGLDTTVIIPWLKENYDYDVIAVCIDVGQGDDWNVIKKRALDTGAAACYVVDAREEYITEYIWPALKANAVYEDRYLLGTSTARPLIGKILVEYARQEKAVAICHGATGKGNDQVRFELAVKAFAPDLKVIAAWRDSKWHMDSRDAEIKYLEDRKIPVPMKKDQSYSRDENIWHLSHEGLELEETENEPNWKHMLKLTTVPEEAPEAGEYVTLDFEAGVPVAVNGKKMTALEIMTELNKIGGRNGVGLVDICENRCVGMKSRGVYETPGGAILYYAHEMLDHLCLDRDTYHYKQLIAQRMSELIYDGKWFTTLMDALMAFVDKTQETVTGWVKLKLYKGSIRGAGSHSPYSLYNESIASFTTGDLYDHKDAQGFITLMGLPLKVRAMMEQKAGIGQAVLNSAQLKKRPTE